MDARWSKQATNFKSDERGDVAMMFGLVATAVIFLAGMAVDYARIVNIKDRVAQAVDAASLAAGRALLDGKLTDTEIQAMATTYFNENVKSAKGGAVIGAPSIRIDRNKGSVDIDVATKVNMTLARVGGFKTMDVPVTSSAVFQQRDIEVGMALDITGSMGQVPSKGGKPKIAALKDAFNNFADRLIPTVKDSSQRVRIGLAPYSASINLGSYAAAATLNRSMDGCVTERKAGTFSDTTDPFNVKADGTKDLDPTEGTGSYVCPSTKLTPLSSDKDALEADVAKFQAGGSTAGHLGIQWAWNLVSDKWGGTWGGDSVPDSFSRVKDGKLLKAVVLMTDGIFNIAYHGAKASEQAISLCDAMKAEGVVVFSVAFDAPPDAQKTLKACATAGDSYYADASNGTELDNAFEKFAMTLTKLRLSK